MLDISLVLSQCFGPRKKEEEEKKRKLQAMKLAKLTKTAAFCVKVPLKYAKVVLFESSCCFTGSDSICAAFHLRRCDYTAYQEQQHHKHKKKKKRRRDDDSGICELKKIIKA